MRMTVFPLIQVVHNRPEIISKNPLKNQGARLFNRGHSTADQLSFFGGKVKMQPRAE